MGWKPCCTPPTVLKECHQLPRIPLQALKCDMRPFSHHLLLLAAGFWLRHCSWGRGWEDEAMKSWSEYFCKQTGGICWWLVWRAILALHKPAWWLPVLALSRFLNACLWRCFSKGQLETSKSLYLSCLLSTEMELSSWRAQQIILISVHNLCSLKETQEPCRHSFAKGGPFFFCLLSLYH